MMPSLKPVLKYNSCTWFKDVPNCAWERLWDWGYSYEEAEIGHVLVACEVIIDLIDAKDDYYWLDYGDKPLILETIKEDAQSFLEKYEQFKGVGL